MPKFRLTGFRPITEMMGKVMVMLVAWLARPAMLVARRVKVEVPAMVGMPVMAPVMGLMLKPSGRLPVKIDQVIGAVPVAVGVKL